MKKISIKKHYGDDEEERINMINYSNRAKQNKSKNFDNNRCTIIAPIIIIIIILSFAIILFIFYSKIGSINKQILTFDKRINNLTNSIHSINDILLNKINLTLIENINLKNELQNKNEELTLLISKQEENERRKNLNFYEYNEIASSPPPLSRAAKKVKNIQPDNKNIIWERGRGYLNRCLKNELIYGIPNITTDNPDITIVIPIYNANLTISSSVRSIQNQNFFNYEIILVNDFSNDNTSAILSELEKEDSRIRIIYNNKNMGTLYSRCIGVLSAKGKYIFSLDNDDMYFVDDVFEMILEIAQQGNFDIVEFATVNAKDSYAAPSEMRNGGFVVHRHNLILTQPDLGLFPIRRKNRFQRNDYNIWSKCVTKELYQNAVNAMGYERYSQYMVWAEDTSIVFVIFNLAKNFKYVRKYGIYHVEKPSSASFSLSSIHKTFGEIFLTNVVYDFSKNNSDKNYAAYQAIDSTKRDFFNVTNSEKNEKFAVEILKKIFDSQYISWINKLNVKNAYQKFNLSGISLDTK